MFVDMTGKKRLKVGLHTHTSRSDGCKSPEEVITLYAAAGYDALALTDHWMYGEAMECEVCVSEGKDAKIIVLSGCEYDVNGINPKTGVRETFHIVGVCMDRKPDIFGEQMRDDSIPVHDRVKMIVGKIREAGGLAVLAHPAWSLNTPEQIMAAGDFDALELYNSVSECGMSDRPYSGILVDMLGARGVSCPLLATDDAHYYDGDECKGMVMVEVDATEDAKVDIKAAIKAAIRAGKFYATQGPEIHLERISADKIRLTCSPVDRIVFFSELPWVPDRVVSGSGLIEAHYTIKHGKQEKFVRAEVTDANGLKAWSNMIMI